MSAPGSVTGCIDGIRLGESLAALKLWETFFQRMVKLARDRLQLSSRAAADEEDVALSAFKSFCAAVKKGRFPCLNDRDDLWQVLFHLTRCKAIDHIKHENAAKCDHTRTEPLPGDGSPGADLAGREPDPADAAEWAEGCRRLLDLLPEDLRLLARRKLEGYTNEEIVGQTGWSLAKVERKLRRIRSEWEEEAAE
jgi:DNA-directed RNA polymerase specialized sigma24 family protein